jgi:hypothetical protein
MTCDEIGSHIQRLQSEIEQSLDATQTLVEDIERRTRALGTQARDAAIGLAVDVVLIATGAGTLVAMIRGARAAFSAGAGALMLTEAVALARDIDTGLSRFEALQEWINIRRIRSQVTRHMDRVTRHARSIDQLWERYDTIACDRR